MTGTQEPDIVDTMEHLREAWLGRVYTAFPGMVTRYDQTTQLASVQPLVMRVRELPDGSREATAYPPIPGVPVRWLGSIDGTYAQTFPLSPGDTGLVTICSVSIDAWIGQFVNRPIDPDDTRHHALSDAVFSPGLRSRPTALAQVASDAWVIAAPKVRLGSVNASLPVALNDELAALISTLAGVTPGVGSGDAAIAALQSYITGHPGYPAGSQKVSVE